ncbi:hypothetical protein [Methylomonas sp. HYX-M1]
MINEYITPTPPANGTQGYTAAYRYDLPALLPATAVLPIATAPTVP